MVNRTLLRLRDDWNRFFFSKTSCDAMTGYRIVLSIILFNYFIYRRWTFFFFFGPQGIAESGLALPRLLPLQFSLFTLAWPHTGSLTLPLYALTLLLVAAFGLGFFTRLSAVGIWILAASWLNPMALGADAADNMMRIQAFLIMVIALAGGFNRKRRPEVWPLRLVQLQLVMIYFYSAVYKLAFPEWREGSALYYVLSDELFGRFDFSWLIGHPLLVQALTYGTVLFELVLFPVLVWVPRLRRIVLAMGILLHLGIAATMKVDGFVGVTAMFYLAFLTEADWVLLARRVPHVFRQILPKIGL